MSRWTGLADATGTEAEETRTLRALEEHGEGGQVAEAQAGEQPGRGRGEPERALACQVEAWLRS